METGMRIIICFFLIAPAPTLPSDRITSPAFLDDDIYSNDGNTVLIFQADGNLVLYNRASSTSAWTVPWASGTNPDAAGGSTVLHDDGNLVVYDSSEGLKWSSALEMSTNYGYVIYGSQYGPYELIVFDYGYAAILRNDGVSIWHSFEGTLLPFGGIWGDWSSDAFCQPGQFGVGFSFKVQESQGGAVWGHYSGDDTAANSFRLICDDGGTAIADIEGVLGSWSTSYCPSGYITGIRIKFEGSQGGLDVDSWVTLGSGGDDTALNDVGIRCSNGDEIYPSNGGAWGDWSGWAECGQGQSVCGFAQRVEGSIQGDDTALNAVKLYCCPHPSSSSTTDHITSPAYLYNVYSNDGNTVLIFQTDGNLVLYNRASSSSSWTAPWASGTNAAGGSTALQGDGNLVVYDSSGSAQWASGTNYGSQYEYTLRVFDAGYAAIIKNDGVETWRASATPAVPLLFFGNEWIDFIAAIFTLLILFNIIICLCYYQCSKNKNKNKNKGKYDKVNKIETDSEFDDSA